MKIKFVSTDEFFVKGKMMLKPLEMAHELLLEIILPGDVVVDATMGNGHDTLFLSALTEQVFAFDVQEAALSATQKRLSAAGKSAQLILDGHEHVAKYVQAPVKAAIFNLGYLPSADKSLITKPDTTIQALSALTEMLVSGGRIALMIYYGHEGGEQEKNEVLDWVSQLDQKAWEVMSYAPLNQIHTPPFLVCIEKK